MKRVLLAATALVTAASVASHPAHALFGVGDIVSDPTLTLQQAQNWAQQFSHNANEISQFVRANSSLTGIVGSLSGAAGVDTSGLNSVRSVLSDVGEVRTAISGTMGTVNGAVGSFQGGFSLSSAASAILNQNTVYRPQSGDFMAQWLNARAQGQASQQAYMDEFVKSAQARQTALLDLKQRQMQATTTDQRMAIQNEIGRTQQELETQEQQARAIAALGDVQERVSQQQILEKQRADAEGLMQATRASADAVGLNPSWASGNGGASLAAAARPAAITTPSVSMAPASIPTFNVSAN